MTVSQSARFARLRCAGLLCLTLALVGGCGGGSSSETTDTTPVAAPLGDPSQPQVIGLKSLKFTPKRVTVKVGQRVDFTWKEGVAHNVVFDAKRKSKTVSRKGYVWSTAFDTAGTFKYKCNLHPGMNGQIDVVK
jgi:plastocyanin